MDASGADGGTGQEGGVMPDNLYSAADLARCAEREVAMRRRVYPERVAIKRMSQALADREIAMMETIAAMLRKQAESERLL
jgi:hypothetical protein